MNKFRIGDRVKVIHFIDDRNDENEEYKSYIGQMGTVIELDSDIDDNILIKFDDSNFKKSYWSEQELELINEKFNGLVYVNDVALGKRYNIEYELGNGKIGTFNNKLENINNKYFYFCSEEDGMDIIRQDRIITMICTDRKCYK